MSSKAFHEHYEFYYHRNSIAILMAVNANKPRNSTNGVSFAELMRMLKGEA